MRIGKCWRGTPALAVVVLVAGMLSAIGLTATPALAAKSLMVTSSRLPGGIEGTVYSTKLHASGGLSPYTWSIIDGTLPDGLTLVPTTGQITGIPSLAVTDDQFTVQVSDSETPAATATAVVSLTVLFPQALNLTTTSMLPAVAGVHYSQKLTATGGVKPYTWSIISGPLPPGLTLQQDTGVISGNPTAYGTFPFTVQVSSVVAGLKQPDTSTASLSISVYLQPLSITTDGQLPSDGVGGPYSLKLAAYGGLEPYTWSISGTLPPGLKLHPATGVISGTPTTAGDYDFVVTVTDSEAPPINTAQLQAELIVFTPKSD
jgi:hypothetical protein